MIQDLLAQQRQYLNHFFDTFDTQQIDQLVELIMQCSGTLFLMGVGKSGIVAEKIATTLMSTGTRAFYLSLTNALHGDLGIVSAADMVMLLSKSGESDELLNLVPFIRNKGAKVIAVVSTRGCRLERAADFTVYLPVDRELCPFDLAPTTSVLVQSLFGDLLAVELMIKKEFTLSEYAMNHPSGRIGRRVTVQVKDLMLRGAQIPLCKPEDKLVDVLVELSNKRCGCLLVVDQEQNLRGIFTDGDLSRTLQKHGAVALHQPIQQLMTSQPRTIDPNALAWDAMKRMEESQKNAITVLPVTEESKVVGLIKMHDILQSGL